jgi:hypothetical protein
VTSGRSIVSEDIICDLVYADSYLAVSAVRQSQSELLSYP